MSHQAVIDQTVQALNRLPADEAERVAAFLDFLTRARERQPNQLPLTFTDFLLRLYEEQQFTKGIQQLTAESAAFAFLADEEELYTVDDLKERYDA